MPLAFALPLLLLVAGCGGQAGDFVDDETGTNVTYLKHVDLEVASLRPSRAMARDARHAGQEPAGLRALRHDFAKLISIQTGTALDPEDVDAFAVDDVTLLVPKGQEVTRVSVGLDASGKQALIDAVGGEDESDAVASAQALSAREEHAADAAPYWDVGTSGSYQIVFRDPANAIAATATYTWAKKKLINDGDGTYDYWSYTRKGIGQGERAPAGATWAITGLYLRNYATAATLRSNKLKDWIDWTPDGDFTGNCSTSPLTISAGAKGVNLSVSFTACDHYHFGINSNVPGEASIKMTQGAFFHEGTRGAAYITVFKVSQGFTPYFHDQQQLEIAFWAGQHGAYPAPCLSTDSDKTCSTYPFGG
ncbi:MAG: hypothetical protein A2V77_01775 [Anaeromyxobacter sp. RBG_16_69_14]|nr:MAG: hypothetical protein A2V77_01775 [Anaeromyxobacter sp. RBG_16_69_14]